MSLDFFWRVCHNKSGFLRTELFRDTGSEQFFGLRMGIPCFCLFAGHYTRGPAVSGVSGWMPFSGSFLAGSRDMEGNCI